MPQGPFKERVRDRYSHVERRNAKEGDIILIQDSNALQGDWRIGIITKPHPSHNNKVQQVTVSYENGLRVTLRSTQVSKEQFRLMVLVLVDDND